MEAHKWKYEKTDCGKCAYGVITNVDFRERNETFQRLCAEDRRLPGDREGFWIASPVPNGKTGSVLDMLRGPFDCRDSLEAGFPERSV